eukprot:2392506-Rhodomonas_salina.1
MAVTSGQSLVPAYAYLSTRTGTSIRVGTQQKTDLACRQRVRAPGSSIARQYRTSHRSSLAHPGPGHVTLSVLDIPPSVPDIS